MTWTASEVRRALGLADAGPEETYVAVSTDTRTLAAGHLFVALEGERFDGHTFLAAAREAGARGAVVRIGTPVVPGLTWYAVPDTLRAYGQLATARRRRVSGPVVAITGTNGKTSTKELVRAVLATRYRTHATAANDNNLVGVPKTILAAPDDTEALVVEAGANLPGEIARYREIIEPDIAIVTNVAEGHLEGFGSLEGVMREKVALTRSVPTVLVGTRPPALAVAARAEGTQRLLTVGATGADVVPDRIDVDADGHPCLAVDGEQIRLRLLGRHQAENALFAWALVRLLELAPDRAARALEGVHLPGGRGEVIDAAGLRIVHDGYNANPASFREAITLARAMRAGRRLVFVAGTMRELGTASEAMHAEIADELVALAPEVLAAVGEFVGPLVQRTHRLGTTRLVCARTAEEVGPLVAEIVRPGDLVILKASRGVALERILPAITRQATATEA